MSHFELPNYRDLSRDQQIPITNLPISNSYIIQGGPGTGKTILAIHRLAKIKDEQPKARTKLLIYNKPLQLHLEDALRAVELNGRIAQTFHSWIFQNTGIRLPGGGLWNYDWKQVRAQVRDRLNGAMMYDHLVVDEAQDIPLPLLMILNELSDTASIFLDPYQAMDDSADNWGKIGVSTVREIFAPEGHATFDLTRNFRNTKEILEVALTIQPFESWQIPERALRSGGPKPIIEQISIDEMIGRVGVYYRNNPTQRLCVVTPNNQLRDDVFNLLSELDIPVQCYKRDESGYIRDYDPCGEGVTVLTYNVIKGLEFDAVFIPFLGHSFFNQGRQDIKRNNLYVAITRAKNYVALYHEGDIGTNWLSEAINKAREENKLDSGEAPDPVNDFADDDIPF